MLRRTLMLVLALTMLATLFLVPASAQARMVGREQRDGVNYTVYEVPPAEPGGDRILYYVEDGALGGGSSSYRFSPRGSGMESAAFIAATLLFLASIFAVYRRLSLLRLLERSTAQRTA